MTCGFETYEGAYVLGSLSPSDRALFEAHLRDCEACSRAVSELAGLPGLLAKVPADVVEGIDERAPVPATLLPGLVAAAQRQQRRRTTRIALLAAAAVAVAAGVGAGTAVTLDDDPPAAPPAVADIAPAQQMTPVGGSASSGWVSLTEVAWGTRLDLTCTYESAYGGDEPWTYLLVVQATDGRTEQAAAWAAEPGKELRVTGATSVRPDDIASVEVQASDGRAVLRLEP